MRYVFANCFNSIINLMANANVSKIKKFYGKHPILSNAVLMGVAALVLLGFVTVFLDLWTMHGSTATVPDVKDKTYAEAKAIIEDADLEIEISDSIYDASKAPGTVIEEWPKGGSVVKAGRQVFVTITAFSPKQVTISMPLTGNVSSRQAISYLNGLGIRDIRVVSVPSDYADLVVGASYNGQALNVGTTLPVTAVVTLQVGNGSARVPVDSVSAEEAIIAELDTPTDISEGI